MKAPLHKVTEYHLHGEGMTIAFHAGSHEHMKLTYNDRVFSGRALSHESTVMGLVVSAVLEAAPDLHTVWLTVVIPDARCPENARSIPVTTFAVITTKRTSIAGPSGVSGQVDTYKVVFPLQGNAW